MPTCLPSGIGTRAANSGNLIAAPALPPEPGFSISRGTSPHSLARPHFPCVRSTNSHIFQNTRESRLRNLLDDAQRATGSVRFLGHNRRKIRFRTAGKISRSIGDFEMSRFK